MAFRPPDPSVSRRARTAAKWAIAVGITGFALKFSGWMLTGSDAVFSDALESVVNIVASLGAYFALRYADRPPDEQHPYGHGGIEFVSALFEGVLVAVAGLVILTHCAESMMRGIAPIEQIDLGLVLVAASAVLNGVAGYALLRVGRSIGSAALIGDGKHLLSDLWTTFAVIGGLIAVWFTGLAARGRSPASKPVVRTQSPVRPALRPVRADEAHKPAMRKGDSGASPLAPSGSAAPPQPEAGACSDLGQVREP